MMKYAWLERLGGDVLASISVFDIKLEAIMNPFALVGRKRLYILARC